MKTGLVLGLDGAGKTLLLRQLTAQLVHKQKSLVNRMVAFATSSCSKYDANKDEGDDKDHIVVDANTQPSVGVEHWTLPLEGGKSCVLREIGGQLLPMWPSYFESCHFWLFLIDASNVTQLAAAAIELSAVLSVDGMRRKPKLLVINHIDAGFVANDAMLQTYLCLDRLLAEADISPIRIVKTSALTGENVDQILRWLGQAASSGYFSGNNSSLAFDGPNAPYGTASRQDSGAGSNIRVYPIAD